MGYTEETQGTPPQTAGILFGVPLPLLHSCWCFGVCICHALTVGVATVMCVSSLLFCVYATCLAPSQVRAPLLTTPITTNTERI